MAAQYTEISLDDMETFLKRGFRALRPKQGVQKGEYYYDLKLSDHVVIRVWTSIQRGSQSGAGVGQDAIRVQLIGIQVDRPLMKGKAPIVKRTQGWKNSLQGKIEDMLEEYEGKADYWDARGSGRSSMPIVEEPTRDEAPNDSFEEPLEPPQRPNPAPQSGIPITPKQLKYLSFLLKGSAGRSSLIRGLLFDYGLEPPYTSDDLSRLTKAQASILISKMVPDQRYAAAIDDDLAYSYDYRGVN